MEELLKAELDEHLDYEYGEKPLSLNTRNGSSKKTVRASYGNIDLNIPRDSEATFEPQALRKYEKDISNIENQIISMYAHGGVFKTKKVMQKIVASALNTSVSIYKSASEGGCWGMACLAMYMDKKDDYKSLDDFLEKFLFANQSKYTELADDNKI